MAKKVPAKAVPTITALLMENADEGVSDGGGSGAEPEGPGEGAVPGLDAGGGVEVGASDGVEAGVGDGGETVVGARAGAGASVGGVGVGGVAVVGAGAGADFGGGVAGGGVAGGVAVVVGGWVGAATGPCAMHEVAKSPKIINT
ncbi:hypothetical protein TanjilG_25553 [Lupinus angustifolius]|uniref:Uncharacterized protein n=1 Tax=Lupinus angustifolius TaxID=3871 RepID=A0A4P1QTH5_LUPAN|nr:PREDICTED: glycine-rich cell wall structural protein-like [Lupinus angustifolius]OIV94491.1 hypothetical protein TanjilG_25553 [Lupinus angustifolius]